MSEYQYEFLELFREEATERLDNMVNALISIERGESVSESVNNLFREAHTIKGAAGMLGLDNVHQLAHVLEDVLHRVRESGDFPSYLAEPILQSIDTLRTQIAGDTQPSPQLIEELTKLGTSEEPSVIAPPPNRLSKPRPTQRRSLQVPAEKIDRLLDLVSETALHRSRLEYVLSTHFEKQRDVDQELDIGSGLLSDLKDAAIGIRTLPFSSIVGAFPRAVRDLALAEHKEVELELLGTDTELDRTILESLPEILTHLLRNAVAHGIESSIERAKANKAPRGTITVAAYQRGSEVEVVVKDDGRGVAQALLDEARSSGSLADVLSRPGFSTSEKVTELSGRGFGLDAVRNAVEGFGGRLDVRSELGKWTTITLTLPLALALLEVMLIERAGCPYGIPLSAVKEVRTRDDEVLVQEERVIDVRGTMVRVADLAVVIGAPALPLKPAAPVVVINQAESQVALACDELIGQEEVVVKSLGLLSSIRHYIGGAILGDGRIALLIDPSAIRLEGSLQQIAEIANHPPVDIAKVLVVEDFFTARELQRRILETAGYVVVTAKDGVDALHQLSIETDCKLVITDVEMPNMDGFELTKTIRSNAVTSGLPVIIVTSREGADEIQRGLDSGADAYMTKKDFNQQILLDCVARLIGP